LIPNLLTWPNGIEIGEITVTEADKIMIGIEVEEIMIGTEAEAGVIITTGIGTGIKNINIKKENLITIMAIMMHGGIHTGINGLLR